MGLVVYECQRADHAHEIREFEGVARALRAYYDGRKELALLIGNVNVGNVELDGIIVKEDAIVILELKDHAGTIVARMNGHWTCDGEIIRGGSNKTVFEQIQVNKRNLRTAIEKNGYFTSAQANDVQGIVVFSAMKKMVNELDRNTKQWLHVSDVANCGGAMHGIKARGWRNPSTGISVATLIPAEAIFNFIRKLHLEESCLVTKMSDVHLLPSDLYHEDMAHDGRDFSTATELAKARSKVNKLEADLDEAKKCILQKDVQAMKKLGDLTVLVARLQDELLKAKDREIELQKRLAETPCPVPAEVPEPSESSVGPTAAVKPTEPTVAVGQQPPKVSTEPERPAVPMTHPPRVLSILPRRQAHLKDWDVPNPDEDQLDLIERTLDKSMLIAGCAGSGKSVIALHKAMKIRESGGDVILIAFTKSLNRYMAAGCAVHGLGNRFYYHWQWKHEGMPKADYIIVDEIQDFTRSEIEEFLEAARKSFFFFGDTAQSIYGKIRPGTLSVEQIAELTGLNVLHLYNNYRLPKPVAQITQAYVGVDVNPYEEAVYQSKERERPRFIAYESVPAQAEAIVRLIKRNKWRNVGILLPSNTTVYQMHEFLGKLNLECECKYDTGHESTHSEVPTVTKDSLDFHNEKPKVMTYHSAKGLQFETVILPMFCAAKSQEARKALYVAMTRTYRNLYVMYTGELGMPLSQVPPHLYLAKE